MGGNDGSGSRAVRAGRAALLAGALATAVVVAPAPPPSGAEPTSTSTTARASTSSTLPPEPAAYVLADVTNGVVLAQKSARTPLPPASTTKILTALTVSRLLPHDGTIPISARAAAQPANKVGVKAGQVWPTEVAMHELLMSSANDLALAFAEAVSGSADAFGAELARTAALVGMEDEGRWRDPAGLDDAQSIGGGNLVTARDLAIASRALLADPWLARIVATPTFGYTAPDGIVHKVTNHNKMLLPSRAYPGTVGVKTGFTKKARHTFVAAATRGGRTLVVVLLASPGDTYGFSSRTLDKGFATPAAAAVDRLPPLRVVRPAPTTTAAVGGATTSLAPPPPVDAPPSTSAEAEAGAAEDLAAPAAPAVPITTEPLSSSAPVSAVTAAAGGAAVALVGLGLARRRSRRRWETPRRRRRGL